MALPASRSTTYVATITQVKAADLNALQDFIVALYKGVHISPARGWVRTTGAVSAEIIEQGEIVSLNSGPSEWNIPIELPEGTIVTEINMRCREPNDVGEVFTMKLFEVTDGSVNQIGDTIATGSTGVLATHTWNDTTNDSVAELPYTMVAGKRLFVFVEFVQTSTAGESQVHYAEVIPG